MCIDGLLPDGSAVRPDVGSISIPSVWCRSDVDQSSSSIRANDMLYNVGYVLFIINITTSSPMARLAWYGAGPISSRRKRRRLDLGPMSAQVVLLSGITFSVDDVR